MYRNQPKFCTVYQIPQTLHCELSARFHRHSTLWTVCQISQTLYIVNCLPDSTDTLHCELSARFHRHSTLWTVCQISQTLYIVHCLPDSTDNLHCALEWTEVLYCLPDSSETEAQQKISQIYLGKNSGRHTRKVLGASPQYPPSHREPWMYYTVIFFDILGKPKSNLYFLEYV